MSNRVAEQFTTACPQCGKHVHASQAHIGKKGRCPACGTVFPILSPATATPPSDTLLPSDTLMEPLGSLPSRTSIWSEVGPSALTPIPGLSPQGAPGLNEEIRLQSDTAPDATLANDYLHRAHSSKTFVEEEETDPAYRFMTSWGSVIGGALTVAFGLFFLIPLFLYFRSIRGVVLGITVIIGGGGWFIQGLNYVSYYRWKNSK